jgi:hypothetical protein
MPFGALPPSGRATGHLIGQADVLQRLAEVYIDIGDLTAAREHLDQATEPTPALPSRAPRSPPRVHWRLSWLETPPDWVTLCTAWGWPHFETPTAPIGASPRSREGLRGLGVGVSDSRRAARNLAGHRIGRERKGDDHETRRSCNGALRGVPCWRQMPDDESDSRTCRID